MLPISVENVPGLHGKHDAAEEPPRTGPKVPFGQRFGHDVAPRKSDHVPAAHGTHSE